MATHLGEIDEEKIDNMSYLLFTHILTELGHKLSYEAVVNYAGNSFCKDSWNMIMDSNPMTIDENGKGNRNLQSIADFLGNNARIATKADLEFMKGHKGNGKA